MDRRLIEIGTRTLVKATLIVISAWVGINIVVVLKDPLVWILIAGFLAIGINPVINRLQRFTGGRRGLAILLVTVLLLALLLLVALRLLPALAEQTQALISHLPDISNDLKNSDSPAAKIIAQFNLIDTLNSNKGKIIAVVTGSFASIFSGTISFFAVSFTIFILMVYFITGGPRWIETLKRSRFGYRYERHESTIKKMQQAISSYVVGNAITSVVAGTSAFIVLVLLEIGFPLPLAFLYGLFDIIPIVGATLGGILLVVVALFKSLPAAIIMLAFILIYQQVETSWLQPRVYGRALQLPDVIIMIAAMLGGVLAGLVGALLAIPFAACVRVLALAYLESADIGSSKKKP